MHVCGHVHVCASGFMRTLSDIMSTHMYTMESFSLSFQSDHTSLPTSIMVQVVPPAINLCTLCPLFVMSSLTYPVSLLCGPLGYCIMNYVQDNLLQNFYLT